ncbi:MAG: pseudouridine synthase [Candidatus Nanoarchaeia archaeon]|nr:pseudouridine synthase [Candidatus Nanoarchaeia archaeon]
MNSSHSLCRVISKKGIMSRKEVAKQIIAGNVCVDGKLIKKPGAVVPLSAKITIQGEKQETKNKIYLLLNKPPRCLTTRDDPLKRRTVYDIVKEKEWVFPVGRLDYDTTGLLIMTNDSEFSEKLASPENKIRKTYIAKIKGAISEEELKKINAKLVSTTGLSSRIEIKISEGKNRQVRNLLEGIGKKVISLSRIAIGELRDNNLKPGAFRKLTSGELKLALKNER